MPLTVGQVAALPDLGLVVRTTGPPLGREVRWVAVSEHADPTPWLEGGDLVLTTGMSLGDPATEARDYIARLMAADVAALGFGVGFSHEVVPEALVDAAEQAGLPVLEVPQPIPFVAVSKAVSGLLAAEEYSESAASFESQRRLIRAVLAEADGTSPSRVVSILARHVGGFVLHLGSSGDVLAAHPPSAGARAPGLADEIDRLRPRGLLASAAVATADEHVVILPTGVRGTAEGFLVVGSPRPLRAADQAVMNLAVSLLSWEASRPLDVVEGMDAWRRLLVSVARDQGLSAGLLDPVGLADLDPAAAVAVTVRGRRGSAVPVSVLADANRSGRAILCRRESGDLAGFAAVDDDGRLPGSVQVLAPTRRVFMRWASPVSWT